MGCLMNRDEQCQVQTVLIAVRRHDQLQQRKMLVFRLVQPLQAATASHKPMGHPAPLIVLPVTSVPFGSLLIIGLFGTHDPYDAPCMFTVAEHSSASHGKHRYYITVLTSRGLQVLLVLRIPRPRAPKSLNMPFFLLQPCDS